MSFQMPRVSRTLTYQQYIALVRRWDRTMLIRGAGWASATNAGTVITPQGPSSLLPWNVAGMAIAAISHAYLHGPTPNDGELIELCWLFGQLWDRSDEDENNAAGMVNRLVHQQMPFQQPLQNEWARPQAVLVDTPFPAIHQPEVMTGTWLEDLLGGFSLPDYTAAGFAYWASATASAGQYRSDSWDESLAGLHELLPIALIEEIGRAHYVSTVDQIKAERVATAGRHPQRQRYGFNPLQRRPFLADVIDDGWIAPSVDLVALKAGMGGLIYAGLERWGEPFARDLGRRFEEYVGRQLSLLADTPVHPEILFGPKRHQQRSVDWIVVLDSLTLLIEVKAAYPTEALRVSMDHPYEPIAQRLAKAVAQLNRTAAAVTTNRTEFAVVPDDRPMLGLVVTLMQFPTAGFAFGMGALGTTDIPVGFLSASDLETLVAHPAHEMEAVLLRALAAATPGGFVELASARAELTRSDNLIIEAAWSANPLMTYINRRRSSQDAQPPKTNDVGAGS